MKRAYLVGLKEFSVSDVNLPEPSENEVLVRVKSVGICGSDVHYYMHGRIGHQVCEYPQVIGHEPSGIVEKPGAGAKKFRKDDRVIIEPQIPCGECHWCRQDKKNVCPNVKFLGTPPIDGAYSEFIVMPEDNLVPLPDSMSFEEGALSEPLAVALHAMELAGDLKGKTVGIFGMGTIGLSILLVARLYGAKTVFCTDILDYRLEFTGKMGADYKINPEKESIDGYIESKTKGLLLDVTFEAAGECEAMRDAINSTTPGGVCVISGIPAEDSFSFDIHRWRRKELDMKLLRRSTSNNVDEAIKLIRDKNIDILPIVTHRFSLDEISKAFEIASLYNDNVIKTMINI